MIQFISEFGLPKEFSKKKKFDLLVGMFIPNDEWKNKDIDWKMNSDIHKVYLTIEECAKATLENALNNGVSEDILKNGYIAIASFTYPTTQLNEIPLARDPYDNPIDCEWNKDTLSFNFTFRKSNHHNHSNAWEELSISTLKVDSFTTKCEDGKYCITSFNVYPVIDNTTM